MLKNANVFELKHLAVLKDADGNPLKDEKSPDGLKHERYDTMKHAKHMRIIGAGELIPFESAPRELQELAENEEKQYKKEWQEIAQYEDPNTQIIKKNQSKRCTEIITEEIELPDKGK